MKNWLHRLDLWFQLNESLRQILLLLTGSNLNEHWATFTAYTLRCVRVCAEKVLTSTISVGILLSVFCCCHYWMLFVSSHDVNLMCTCRRTWVRVQIRYIQTMMDAWYFQLELATSNKQLHPTHADTHTHTHNTNRKDRKFREHKIIYGCAIKLLCVQL